MPNTLESSVLCSNLQDREMLVIKVAQQEFIHDLVIICQYSPLLVGRLAVNA